MKKQTTKALSEAAIMLALAFALSSAELFEMPLGGSVTVASMLPIMMISFKYGTKWGLSTAFLYSITQALQALASGNVFPYCETGTTLVICVLFDYVFPFAILGLAGIFRRVSLGKFRHFGAYAGIVAVTVFRFLCHFVTGVVIWGQWAPEGMGKYLYSLLYNGGYMLPELGITLLLAVLVLETPAVRRLIGTAKG